MTRHCAWFPRGHTSNVLRERLARLGGVLPQVPEFGRRIPSRSPRVRRGHFPESPCPPLRRPWVLSLGSPRRGTPPPFPLRGFPDSTGGGRPRPRTRPGL